MSASCGDLPTKRTATRGSYDERIMIGKLNSSRAIVFLFYFFIFIFFYLFIFFQKSCGKMIIRTPVADLRTRPLHFRGNPPPGWMNPGSLGARTPRFRDGTPAGSSPFGHQPPRRLSTRTPRFRAESRYVLGGSLTSDNQLPCAVKVSVSARRALVDFYLPHPSSTTSLFPLPPPPSVFFAPFGCPGDFSCPPWTRLGMEVWLRVGLRLRLRVRVRVRVSARVYR